MLLPVANAVQNGIIGNDITVTGAVIGAVTLFGINELFNRAAFSSSFVSRLFEGEVSVAIPSKPVVSALRRASISSSRAIARVRASMISVKSTVRSWRRTAS